MARKYDIPNETPQTVSEAAVAYANAIVAESGEGWERNDAPCAFTDEELRTVLLSSLEDERNGNLHTHADVQTRINSRIAAWR